MGILSKAQDFLITNTLRGMTKFLPLVSDEKLTSAVKKRIDTEIPYPEGRDFVLRIAAVAKSHLAKASANCRKRAVEAFLINSQLKGAKVREALKERLGYWAPYLFVVSPTMRCNLSCYGCYAGEYEKSGKETDLPWELLDSAMQQAKEMGIYFVVISGGEPFAYEHIFRLLEEHKDMYFQMYTNGSLITPDVTKRLADLGNLIPCISVEGFEKETDARRGKGHFKKIMNAMEALRKNGVLFGYSATATRENNDMIVSEKFVDFYIDKGCFIGWYFNYIPIGRAPKFELMPTPEQRIRRKRQLSNLRMEKDILLADFWCDGPLCGGCIAGGRHYFHINNKGDVEPCVFIHFAKYNLRDMRLDEILDSDFFRAFRRRQPYDKNLMRPCAIIDNPEILREVVEETGAYPSHEGADSIIADFAPQLDKYAQEYGRVADDYWFNEYLPSLTESDRKTFLDYIDFVKADNAKVFARCDETTGDRPPLLEKEPPHEKR
jgi:MoaA/NifB/PqqE/SkfB family radical SAM enzyme